jgi:hypothetical protein
MLTDFFGHKIHSADDTWGDKLILVASIFNQFDGHIYNREAIVERFAEISPRANLEVRDVEKFRDEFSAYQSLFGIYRIEWNGTAWMVRMGETAKRFLTGEEPNVAAFLLLQLLFLQFPNGRGVQKHLPAGRVSLQSNSRTKTLEYIRSGLHVSPVRLICKALKADALLNGIDSHHPYVTVDEIYTLANDSRTNQTASPLIDDVKTVLSEIRTGVKSVVPGENRFHTLNHTDFLEVSGSSIYLRPAGSKEEQDEILAKLDLINSLADQFEGFDTISTKDMLAAAIATVEWEQYFDGMKRLTSEQVEVLTGIHPGENVVESDDVIPDNSTIRKKYPLKDRGTTFVSYTSKNTAKSTDPEVTRIRHQRSALAHRVLLNKLDQFIRERGAIPQESEHIDLYAKIPDDGSFLFEVKSVTSENLLSQTRKGVSQLYEYRYRYQDEIGKDVVLCLVYPNEPTEIDWLEDYLCIDRQIAVCWFDQNELRYASQCATQVKSLLMNTSMSEEPTNGTDMLAVDMSAEELLQRLLQTDPDELSQAETGSNE